MHRIQLLKNVRRRSPKRLLMVCLDNTCRSPIAEAVMRREIEKAELQSYWQVDSAAIEDWHLKCNADQRAIDVLANHNIDYEGRVRLLTDEDFEKYDYIFGMDQSTMASLRRSATLKCKAKLLLLGDFGLKPDDRIIEDPYYDVDEESFEKIYKQCSIACSSFITQERLNQIL